MRSPDGRGAVSTVLLAAAVMLASTATRAAASGAGVSSGNEASRDRAPAGWASGLRWIQPAGFRAADLAGKPVIVEFWTFACINCRRTIPAMRALEARWGKDVAIVGVHTPELEIERDAGAVRAAIAREGIRYAVAQDNEYRTWNAFGNQYWPALYVIDARGRIRDIHVGELHERTPAWNRLQALLAELRAESRPRPAASP